MEGEEKVKTMSVSMTGPRIGTATLPKFDLLIASGLFVLTICFLYVLRPIEMSDNSLGYVTAVRDAAFFYPPHLLHAAIIFIIHSLLSQNTSCDIVCAGMIHSMIWAAIAIFSIYMVARVVLPTVAGALATTLMVLVAHGFWVFATQLEVYVPAVGCIAAATALLFTNAATPLTRTRVVAVSALWALATMYHLANVLFFIPLCAFFYGTQGWHGWRQLVIISALAGSTVLGTFLVVYGVEHEQWSFDGFLSWALEITDRPLTDWGSASNWWRPSKIIAAVASQIKALTMIPEYITYDQRPLGVIGVLAVGMTLLWNVRQALRSAHPAVARVYFLLLFAPNFLFSLWWQPHVHKFYIFSSIPLILLMALAVSDVCAHVASKLGRGVVAGGVFALITIVGIFNLSSILELRRSYGPDYAEAEVLNRLAPANCTIYAAGHHLNPLAVYFARENRVPVHDLERAFYRVATGESAAERPIFDGEECAFIPLGFLSEGWYRKLMDGYLDTGTWPEYVGYFLDVSASSAGDGITYDAFELVAEGDGPPHLLVDRTRRVHGQSLGELAQIIRTEVGHAVRKYEADYPTLEQDVLLAEVPRADFEIGRVRGRIFGYSFGDQARRVSRLDDRAGR